ncbi:MAG: hypothetical protein IJ793_04405 [Opitutales bacterium]|nr:hypothetical protein [Opitutales bacterium]
MRRCSDRLFIPPAAGVDKAVGLVWHRKKLTGISFRVSTPIVSTVGLTVYTAKPILYKVIDQKMKDTSKGR